MKGTGHEAPLSRDRIVTSAEATHYPLGTGVCIPFADTQKVGLTRAVMRVCGLIIRCALWLADWPLSVRHVGAGGAWGPWGAATDEDIPTMEHRDT
jgi:hypothetical protein